MIYLASPYTDPDPAVMQRRYSAVVDFTIKTLGHGIILFSPIVYTHHMANVGALPKDFTYWQRFNMEMLDFAEALWVLRLPGWERSEGVRNEIDFASEVNLKLTYHDPI